MFRSTSPGWAALLLALLAPPAVFARQHEPPVNAWGLPVLDGQGQRLSYGAAELKGSQRGLAPAGAALAPSGVTARWGYAAFGTCIGMSGIVLADGEIYTGGSISTFGPNDYWYVLRYVPETASYEQVFVSRRLPGIKALGVADVSGDGRKEIVVVQDNGSVVLFDQRSRAELSTLGVAPGVAGMALRDLDGDGKAEILLTTDSFNGNTFYALSGSGAVLWQRPGAGGLDVAVGNMDGDPSTEIATTSGVVLDWASRTVQWQRPQGFGIDLAVGDIDGDGRDELVAAQDWDFVWAFDVDTQLPKWSLPVFDVGAIWLGNADADSRLELIVGDGQWGDVHAFDTVTMVEEWAIANPEHGVTFVAVGDPNANGVADVLWGAGATSTGSDRLYVANLASHAIDSQNIQLEGPFLSPQQGDVDGDGVPEIVTCSTSSDADYDSGRIVVLDGATLRVRAISDPIVGNLSWVGAHDLRLRNVDADPQLEIVVAADRLYDGVIEIYDFAGATGAFTLKWTNTEQPSGAPFYAVDVADIDADGQLEVVGGVGKAHTGQQGTDVYAYSYASGAEEWHTFTLTTSWVPITGLAVLTQGGGVADIVAMVDGESLNFFNGLGQPQSIVNGPFRFLGPDAPSANRSFLLGTAPGELRQYQKQGSGYGIVWSRALGGPAIDGATLLAGGELAVASGGRLSLYPQRDGVLSWQSEDYGVLGRVVVGSGANRRPFAGGAYALVTLAPWRTLLSVQPPEGPAAGGTVITASGTAFAPSAQLFVGVKAAVGTQIFGSTQAVGATPSLRRCTRNTVSVVNPDMSYELLEDAFRAGFGFTCGRRDGAALLEGGSS